MAKQYLHVLLVVMTYWIVSISMVFANKFLVGGRLTPNLAIVITWMQCIGSVLCVLTIKLIQSLFTYFHTGEWIFYLPLHLLHHKHVIIMSLTFVCMIGFNNLCLKLVGVAFFQVARSTTIIFTVLFSAWMLKQAISLKIVLCCLTVVAGFALGVDQEKVSGSLSLPGVCFGVVTSIFIALTGIFTKKCLEVVEHNSLHLTLLSNLNGSILFLPVIYFSGQWTHFLESPEYKDRYFWTFLLLSGAMACSMAWISAKQIDLTSPVTHHISANSKSVVQTVFAVIYYKDHKPPLWWGSILLVVGGAMSYAILRIKEISSQRDIKEATDVESNQIGTVGKLGQAKIF